MCDRAFAAFLAPFLDGPSEDAQQRWWLSLRESHLRFEIGRKERDAWMNNMIGALDDVPMRIELGLHARLCMAGIRNATPTAVPCCTRRQAQAV
jgi:truncated hemoglobin YjbI